MWRPRSDFVLKLQTSSGSIEGDVRSPTPTRPKTRRPI
uniref:Uncharacterized protein n=1 Tax=Arundo donax TaxID=35708 RepID=A0A0A9B5H2_ARUDO